MIYQSEKEQNSYLLNPELVKKEINNKDLKKWLCLLWKVF